MENRELDKQIKKATENLLKLVGSTVTFSIGLIINHYFSNIYTEVLTYVLGVNLSFWFVISLGYFLIILGKNL